MENRGNLVIGAAVALAAAGLLRVDGALLALGAVGGLFMGIAAVAGRWNLRGLTREVEGPKVGQAGDEVRLGVRLSNPRRWLGATGLALEIRGAGGLEAECEMPWVAAGDGAAGDLRVLLPGRGVGTAFECRVVSGFPWGLLRFEREIAVPHEMKVVPQPVVPGEMRRGTGALESGERRRPGARESFGDLRGLRDYRAGDRAKAIAWAPSLRSAAQGGGVLVRELDPPGRRPERVVLLFHSYGTDRALIRPDRFERALALAWGAVRRLRARRMPVVWMADFEEWVPREIDGRGAMAALGDALARARRARGTEAHEVEGRLEEIDGEVVVISDMPPASWAGLVEGRARVRVIDVTAFERGRRLKGGADA